MFSSLNKRDKNNNIIYSNRGKQVGLTKNLFGLGNVFIGGRQSYRIRNFQSGQNIIANLFNNTIDNNKHKIKYCHIGSRYHQYQSICLIDNDCNMYMAGYNEFGQLGQFYETNRNSNTLYQSKLNNIVPKKVMFNQCNNQGHFCIMMSQDNQLYYCGRNEYVWGTINKFTMFNIKQFDVKDFCVGRNTIYVLDTNGFVWGCGQNRYGQLACGNWESSYSNWIKISPPQGQKFIKVVSYYLTTYFLTDKGNIYGCGYGQSYQLGSYGNKCNIVKVNGDIKCKDVDCGFFHFIAQDFDDNIYGMGGNGQGQLGVGDYSNKNSMVKIGQNVKAKKIFAGGYNSYYIDEEGFLYGTGLNSYQQIAYGLPNNIANFNKFQHYKNIKQVCCTHYTTMILGESTQDV